VVLYNGFSTCLQASSSPKSVASLRHISGLCGLVVDCYKPGISKGELTIPLTPGVMYPLQLLQEDRKTA